MRKDKMVCGACGKVDHADAFNVDTGWCLDCDVLIICQCGEDECIDRYVDETRLRKILESRRLAYAVEVSYAGWTHQVRVTPPDGSEGYVIKREKSGVYDLTNRFRYSSTASTEKETG